MKKNKIQTIAQLPWKKVLLSALIVGSLTLAAPLKALDANFIVTSGTNQNLTVLNGGSSVSLSVINNGSGGNTANITSSVNNAVLGFVNFGNTAQPIGVHDVVNETVPSGSAILNTISGGQSTISGAITSNGKVFLLNPAGVILNSTAVVNTAGFYVSTIPENISYFVANGTLQAFSSNPSAGTTTGTITANFTGAGSTGNVFLAGNSVTVQAGTINGNLTVISDPTTANVIAGAVTGVSLASTGNLAVTGNLAAQSEGANIVLSTGANTTTVTGSSSLDTATLAPSNTSSLSGTISQGNSGTFTTAGLTINSASPVTLAGDKIGSGLSLTAGTINAGASSITTSDTGGLTLNNNAVVNGSLTLANTSNGVVLNNLTVNNGATGGVALNVSSSTTSGNGGITSTSGTAVTITGTNSPTVSLTTNAGAGTGSVSYNAAGNVNFSTLALNGTSSSLTLTGTGNITLPASVSAASVAITAAGNLSGGSTVTTPTTAGSSVSETAGGSLTVATINSPAITLSSTGGSISETGGLSNGAGAATLTVNSASSITLTTAANNISTLVATGPGSLSFIDTPSTGVNLTLGSGTTISGNTAITVNGSVGNASPGILIGANATDTLSFGGNLSLTAAVGGGGPNSGSIGTNAYNLTVAGNTSLATTNAPITLGCSAALGIATNYSFGQVSASAGTGNISLNENSTLNLGTITTTGTISATSSNGNIINSGVVTDTTGQVTLAAGTALTNAGTITLGSTTAASAIGGNIQVNDASAFTLINGSNTTLIAGGNALGSANITTTNGGTLNIGTLGSPEGITTLSFNTQGTTSVFTKGSTTLTNLATGGSAPGFNVNVESVLGAITLGSGINLSTTGTTTFTATSNKANIVDTANSPVYSYGAVVFQSDAGINVSNNTNNSLGPVTLTQTNTGTGSASSSAGNSAVNYTEGGSVNLAGMTILGTGNVTIKSVTGSITEGTGVAAGAIADTLTGSAVVTFSAPTGAVLLTDTGAAGSGTNAAQNIEATIAVTALTDSTIADSPANGKVVLGNIVANGAFTVDASQLNAANFSQISQNATATTIWVYGSSTFKANGTGSITMTNSGNNFGGITATVSPATQVVPTVTAGGAIAITENGTSNYTFVSTQGSLTSVSQTGSIIEAASGTGTGIKVGTGSGEAGLTGIAASSFTVSGAGAAVTLTNTLNDFGGSSTKGVKIVTGTGENASLTDSDLSTYLADGTNVPGSLTVLNNNSGASLIADAGATNGTVTVGQILSLSSLGVGGSVSFTGSTNNIAQVTIKAGSGSSTFTDGANLQLAGSSVVTGPLTITANSITAAGNSPSTFQGTVNLTAQIGAINLTDAALFFQKQVTLSAATGANLSALSLSINFSGIAPNPGATPNYVPPGP